MRERRFQVRAGGVAERRLVTRVSRGDGTNDMDVVGGGRRGECVISTSSVVYSQRESSTRGRFIGVGRGDGSVNAQAFSARQPYCEQRGIFTGVSRGDGITGGKSFGLSQRERFTCGRFISLSRGDGCINANTFSARQRGFSLIEIILVVVLIGGIVAFAATRILGGGDRARVNLARAQVQTMADKVSQFEMDTGTLPASLDQLVTQPGGAVGWLGPYARESELKDPWNTPLEYRAPGDGRAYDIVSLGADRKAGGDSVDADIRND